MPSPILAARMRVGKNLVSNDGVPYFVLCGTSMRRMFRMTDIHEEDVMVRLYDRKVPKSIPIRIKHSVNTRSSGLYSFRNFPVIRWTAGKQNTPQGSLRSSAHDVVKSHLFKNVNTTQTKTVWLCVSCGRKRLDPSIGKKHNV